MPQFPCLRQRVNPQWFSELTFPDLLYVSLFPWYVSTLCPYTVSSLWMTLLGQEWNKQPDAYTGNIFTCNPNLLSTETSCQLCSAANTRLFRIPSFRTKTNRQRSFSYQAQTIWNSLPPTVRYSTTISLFKSCLKTYLFKKQMKIILYCFV